MTGSARSCLLVGLVRSSACFLFILDSHLYRFGVGVQTRFRFWCRGHWKHDRADAFLPKAVLQTHTNSEHNLAVTSVISPRKLLDCFSFAYDHSS